jgi:hypothetical protein
MFAGDDFKASAKASSTLGKPADSVRSDTALRPPRAFDPDRSPSSSQRPRFSFGPLLAIKHPDKKNARRDSQNIAYSADGAAHWKNKPKTDGEHCCAYQSS